MKHLAIDEQWKLVEAYQAGDSSAFDKLCETNERFLVGQARRWLRAGCDEDDLMQEARIGYLRGVQLLDKSKCGSPLTYAGMWVRQRLGRFAQENNALSLVRRPVHRFHTRNEWKQLYENPDKRLDADFFRSTAPSAEEVLCSRAAKEEARAVVHDALDALHGGDRYILELRYLEEPAWTLEEIGKKMRGVSREMIRQIEKKALFRFVSAVLMVLRIRCDEPERAAMVERIQCLDRSAA